MPAAAEAGESLRDVGRVAGLALLAVAHDVDPGVDLARHDAGDGLLQHPLLRRVVGGAVAREAERLDEAGRPREASGVRGEDAVGHRVPSRSLASRAPSTSVASFAHATSDEIRPPSPQSVPAMTRSGPTTSA